MKNYSDNSPIDAIFYGAIFLGLFIQAKFFDSWNSLAFWICWIVVAYVISSAAGEGHALVTRLFLKIKLDNTICPHGLRGGLTVERCPSCRRKKKEETLYARQRQEAEIAERSRKKEIADSAKELRISEHRRLTRERLHKLEHLRTLSPVQFEQACAEMFRAENYETKLTAITNDEGVDIRLRQDGQNYVVQCKRFGPGNLVGRPDLQKLLGVIASEKSDGGYFVTTSGFSGQAINFAEKNGIYLIDGVILARRMAQAFGGEESLRYHALCLECGVRVTFKLHEPERTNCANGHAVESDFDGRWFLDGVPDGIPTCKKCGKPLRKVSGRNGLFWGCPGYPDCRFTVNIDKGSRRRPSRS